MSYANSTTAEESRIETAPQTSEWVRYTPAVRATTPKSARTVIEIPIPDMSSFCCNEPYRTSLMYSTDLAAAIKAVDRTREPRFPAQSSATTIKARDPPRVRTRSAAYSNKRYRRVQSVTCKARRLNELNIR